MRRDSPFPVKTFVGILIAMSVLFLGITYTSDSTLKPVDEDLLTRRSHGSQEVKGEAEEGVPLSDQGIAETSKVQHVTTPKDVRGIYVSAFSFITPSFHDRLKKLLKDTSINTIVVDIKDAPGIIMYDIGYEHPCVKPSISKEQLENRIKEYHDLGIYVVARVAVFRDECFVKQDASLAVMDTQGNPWRDKGGNYWLAPHEEKTREYIKDISLAVYERGFDEIQLDYIRYPSDGNMSTLRYEYVQGQSASSTVSQKRRKTIGDFMAYMRTGLSGIPLSADIFGMVLTNADDLSIGQHLEEFVPHVDFISPMIYPSHFPKQWNGIADTNRNPYQTIYDSTKQGLDRMYPVVGTSTAQKMMRPWLQDFSIYGVIYNAPEVKAQIKALEDLGVKSFLLWNASNRYTPGVL